MEEKELLIEIDVDSGDSCAPEKVIELTFKSVDKISMLLKNNKDKNEIVIEIEEAV